MRRRGKKEDNLMLQFATKHDDPDRKLGWVERIGFGMASFGWGMMTAVLGSFIIKNLRKEKTEKEKKE